MTRTGPVHRPRRLRRTPAIRRLVAETRLHPAGLIWPLFAREGLAAPREIATMPGVDQHSQDSLARAAEQAAAAGLGAVMLFGVPATRDPLGCGATDPRGVLTESVRRVRATTGDDLPVIADLCLDEFTDHGHCGVLAADGSVDNDATLERYAEMAVVLADAGADLVGTSGMMDGQVSVVRAALDAAGHSGTGILAYAAKYSSAFYGPFRAAVESTLRGDRRTYQQDPANARESLREVRLDVEQGADVVMVKPALGYLDVVAAVRAEVEVPVAAYVVSGELAMIEAAAAAGAIERRPAILESLTGVQRAGAGLITTYWALEVAGWLAGDD